MGPRQCQDAARPVGNRTKLDKDEQFYRNTESIAFPKLDDRQVAMLEALGARRIVRCGELVFKAGQRDLGLTAVLRGELEVFVGSQSMP
jgi:thioredoxin reductase (NADPH)